MTYLSFDYTVFGTSNQYETFYFQEIRKFGWIEFTHTDRVAFLVVLCK